MLRSAKELQGYSIYADLTREEIKSAPEWDPNAPLEGEYEARLHEHYGRPPYWVYR